jgi:hypothetical protein
MNDAQLAPDVGPKLADQLLEGAEKGQIKNIYQFAQQTLFSCMAEKDLSLESDISATAAQACYYRSDVIYYTSVSRSAGNSKEQAIEKVAGAIKNRRFVSEAFIADTANLMYSRPDDLNEVQAGRRVYVRSCLVGSKGQ